MKQYNIYGGIDSIQYLYTGLYNNIEEAKLDAWLTVSHIANSYPNNGNIRYKVVLTEVDNIEELIMGYGSFS